MAGEVGLFWHETLGSDWYLKGISRWSRGLICSGLG